MARNPDEVWQTAQAAWPDLALPRERFLAYLSARAPDDWDGLHAADLYLACACACGDPAALAVFEGQYLGRLGAALARDGCSRDTIDEVLQRVRVDVLVRDGERAPGIEGFRGKSELGAWLRVVGTREAARVEKRARKELLGGDDSVWVNLVSSDPELSYLKDHYREVVVRALRSALAQLAVDELALLKSHLVDGLSIDEIGAQQGVHRATAARRLERARERLCDAVRDEIERHLRISSGEIDELLQLVRSRLDVSMRRVLLALA
jgi:RNA polymerase sigma-70 factor (ECF subfamily)